MIPKAQATDEKNWTSSKSHASKNTIKKVETTHRMGKNICKLYLTKV